MRVTALLLAQVALSVASQVAPASLLTFMDPKALNQVVLVRIPCNECPGADKQDLDMGFEFYVSPNDHSQLMINGETVLPLNPADGPLSARMIPRDADLDVYLDKGSQFPELGLDYTLMIKNSVTDVSHEQDSLELRVYAVDGKPVEVDGLVVEITKGLDDGYMALNKVYQVPAKPPCTSMSCMMKSMIEKMMIEKISKPIKNFRKPCHGKGRKMAHHNAVAEGLEGLDMDHLHHLHHGGAHHDGPHGHHSGHHKHHGHKSSMFHSFVGMVLLPILAGILVGFATFLIGMTVGHLIRFVVCKVRGKSLKCPRARKNRQDVEAGDKEAATGLLEEEQVEAPPAYKDDVIVEAVEKE